MRYRTFKGKSKQEAYAQLDAEKKIDPDLKEALLIKDSEFKVSSFMGFKQETIYEVLVGIPTHTAFFEKRIVKPLPKPSLISLQNTKTHFSAIEKSVIDQKNKLNTHGQDTLFAIKSIKKVAEQLSQLEKDLPKKGEIGHKTKVTIDRLSKENELTKELATMRKEFKELKILLTFQQKSNSNSQLVDTLQESRTLPNEYEICRQHIRWIDKYLNEREFAQTIIDDIINHLEQTPEILTDKKNILKVTEEFLQQHIPINDISLDNYKYGNEIIFIGPTGVGKTISLVKLAVHLSLMRKKSFRFISIDRYKVGGETQLEKLASYINTPFDAINKQEEFFTLLAKKNTDFTFIDTAGKGPKETIAIQELVHWISQIGHPIDTHLVVSATTKVTDLYYICDSYNVLNYNHILVTKLDETKTFGSIISLAYKYQKPLSFITDGQEIPQDFEIANIYRLIKESLK